MHLFKHVLTIIIIQQNRTMNYMHRRSRYTLNRIHRVRAKSVCVSKTNELVYAKNVPFVFS